MSLFLARGSLYLEGRIPPASSCRAAFLRFHQPRCLFGRNLVEWNCLIRILRRVEQAQVQAVDLLQGLSGDALEVAVHADRGFKHGP